MSKPMEHFVNLIQQYCIWCVILKINSITQLLESSVGHV